MYESVDYYQLTSLLSDEEKLFKRRHVSLLKKNLYRLLPIIIEKANFQLK